MKFEILNSENLLTICRLARRYQHVNIYWELLKIISLRRLSAYQHSRRYLSPVNLPMFFGSPLLLAEFLPHPWTIGCYAPVRVKRLLKLLIFCHLHP